MTNDERRRVLGAVFESVARSTPEGVVRMEPAEEWKPYVVAAVPRPVALPTAPMSGYTHLYFVAKGRDREQYAGPLTKRVGGRCEPVSGGAELAREPRA